MGKEHETFECQRCEGTGKVVMWTYTYGTIRKEHKDTCKVCGGTGKLDWIENITCQKTPPFTRFIPTIEEIAHQYEGWKDYYKEWKDKNERP